MLKAKSLTHSLYQTSKIFKTLTKRKNIEELLSDIQKCRKCKNIIGYEQFPTDSHGQLSGKYLLVSEAPGKKSLKKQKYWTSVGGQILRTCTLNAGTTLEDLFYLTDIVKCWPNENDKDRTPYDSEVKSCSNFLMREIEEIMPALIVSFGRTASSYLLGRDVRIKSEHGSICKYNEEVDILILLHPTGIDRQMNREEYKQQLTSLFKKLKEGKQNEIAAIFKD